MSPHDFEKDDGFGSRFLPQEDEDDKFTVIVNQQMRPLTRFIDDMIIISSSPGSPISRGVAAWPQRQGW